MSTRGFEEYADDAGYSGHCIGDMFDDIVDGLTLGPLRRAASGDDPSNPQQVDVLDDNSVAQAGANSDAQIARSMTPAGGFPSWAGSPQIFMGRITKLNALMGTNFAVNTSPLDPQLMAVVRTFQQRNGLTADGEMGPKTEAKEDQLLGGAAPVTPPAAPLAVAPAAPAPSGAATPVVAKDASGDKTKLFVALGIGGVVLLGLGYFALKD